MKDGRSKSVTRSAAVSCGISERWRASSNLFDAGIFESRDGTMARIEEDVGRRVFPDRLTYERGADYRRREADSNPGEDF